MVRERRRERRPEPRSIDPPLAIGELARRTGVSRDTLRFYERKGLLAAPARRANGYRAYPPAAVERVLRIRRVLAAGFTLDELASVLAERDGGGVPCRRVRDLGAAKLIELEARRCELEAACASLRALLADWDRRLEAAPPDERAGLLDAIEPMDATSRRRPSTAFRKTTRRDKR